MSDFVDKVIQKKKATIKIKTLCIQCVLAEEHIPTPKNTPPSIERRTKTKDKKSNIAKKLFDT
jgi:hypothetical protein